MLDRRRRAAWLLLLGLAVPLCVRALELRLPKMTRAVWEDEVHHNQVVLAVPTVAALDDSSYYRMQLQPKLDFAMRKVVWFPLFGMNERAMRLPALIWGLALVLLVYAVLVTFLRQRVDDLRLAALLAFIGSLWIVDNPMEVHYATEARHYSLIAFASTAWFAVLLLFDGKPRWLLGVASLLLANTHYFALPLIAAGYGLQLLREVRARAWRYIPLHLVFCGLIYACTVTVNWASFSSLLEGPPGATVPAHAPLSAVFQLAPLQAGLSLWLDYSRALGVPPATWVVWLFLAVDAIWHRRTQWLATLAAAFVVMPAIFVFLKSRSSYPFGDRYFSAFFGLGLVTVAAGLDLALRAWKALAPRLAQARRPLASALAIAALALAFGAPRFAWGLVADTRALRPVPKNFSPYFRAYDELVRDGRSAYILHTHCYTNDIQALYFYFFIRASLPHWPYNLWLYWSDALGCDEFLPTVLPKVRAFLAEHVSKGGIIVLDDKERDCGNQPVPTVPPPATVERFRTVSACMWKVGGISTMDQLRMVAELVHFSAARNLR